MGQPIDRAYVEILPDLSKFDRDAAKDIAVGLKGIEIAAHKAADNVENSFENAFQKMQREALASFAKIKIEAEALSPKVTVHVDIDRNSTGSKLEGSIGSILSTTGKDVEKDAVNLGRQVGTDIAKGAETSLGDIGRELSGIFTAIQSAFLPVIIAIGVQLAGALGPALVALAATLPAAIGVAGSALGTLLIGFQGIDNAVKNFGDIQKYNEALKQLSPSAVAFVNALKGLMPVFDQIKKATQESLFSGLDAQLKSVVGTLSGPVKAGLSQIGVAFNGLAKGFADFLTSSTGLDLIKTLLGTTADIINQFGPALKPLLEGFAKLTISATPFLELLTGALAKALASFGTKLSALADSGQLEKFFNQAFDTLVKLAPLAENVFGIIIKILTASGPSGQSLIDTLVKVTDSILNVLDTKAGIETLSAAFTIFGFAIESILAPFIAAKKVGEFLGKTLFDLKTSLEDFGSKVSEVGSIVGGFVDLLQASFGRALQIVGEGIGLILVLFTQGPDKFIQAILPLFTKMGDFFSNVFANAQTFVINGFNNIVTFIASIPGRLLALGGEFLHAGINLIKGFINGFSSGGDLIGGVAGSIVGAIKGFLNGVIDKINGGINDVGSSLHVKLPNIPKLASGGIAIGGGTLAQVGEAGDEAILPLSGQRGRETFDMIAKAATANAPTINFGPGSVVVSFEGAVPTHSEAQRTGEAVGMGIASILAKRDIRTQLRTA